MTDTKYLFKRDIREKKDIARSSRSKRAHNGKRGRVKFPSDYMTKKELKAMNGEVKSYPLNKPMNWGEFKAMPDDIKVDYNKLLRQKFDVPDTDVGKMMGVSQNTIAREIKRLGIVKGKGVSKRSWDKEAFFAWCYGIPEAVEKTEEEVAEEVMEQTDANPASLANSCALEQADIVEEASASEVHEEKRNAIPTSGRMTFEGNMQDILRTISNIFGNANLRVQIAWDVIAGGE